MRLVAGGRGERYHIDACVGYGVAVQPLCSLHVWGAVMAETQLQQRWAAGGQQLVTGPVPLQWLGPFHRQLSALRLSGVDSTYVWWSWVFWPLYH